MVGLTTVGAWAHGAGRGYERGKADATHALTPFGAVVVEPSGACHVYDQPGQMIVFREPARVAPTFLIREEP